MARFDSPVHPVEINPLMSQLEDLRSRVDALRGYL